MKISQQNNSQKAVNFKSIHYSQSSISGLKLGYFERHNNNNMIFFLNVHQFICPIRSLNTIQLVKLKRNLNYK